MSAFKRILLKNIVDYILVPRKKNSCSKGCNPIYFSAHVNHNLMDKVLFIFKKNID